MATRLPGQGIGLLVAGANGREAQVKAQGESNTCQAIDKWPAGSGGSKWRSNHLGYHLRTSCILSSQPASTRLTKRWVAFRSSTIITGQSCSWRRRVRLADDAGASGKLTGLSMEEDKLAATRPMSRN